MAELRLEKEPRGFKLKTRTGAPTPLMEYEWVIYDGALELRRFPFADERLARAVFAKLQAERKLLMSRSIQCTCGAVNGVGPALPAGTQYRCGACGALLPTPPPQQTGDRSAAVGLLGGAALGAALAGPPGAVVGAIVGAIVGKAAKGVG